MKNIIAYIIQFVLIISGIVCIEEIDNELIPIWVKGIMWLFSLFTVYLPLVMFWGSQREKIMLSDYTDTKYHKKDNVVFNHPERGSIVCTVVDITKLSDHIVYVLDEHDRYTLHITGEDSLQPYNPE